MSIDTAVATLRDTRAQLLRELELVEDALAILAPTLPSGLVVAAPSVAATPEAVRPPVTPQRAVNSQPKRKSPRYYTDEEKRVAVALVERIGRAAAARELGILGTMLDRWRREARQHTTPATIFVGGPPVVAPLSDTPKVSFADRIRAETADIEQRRKTVAAANGDRPKATIVPTGLPRQPIDEQTARRAAMAAAYPGEDELPPRRVTNPARPIKMQADA